MSYTPTDWKTGDTIFAEQLNNMESGIAGGQVFEIVPTTASEVNQTSEEILAAIDAGKTLFFVYPSGGGPTSGTVCRVPLVQCTKKRNGDEYPPTGGAEQTNLHFISPIQNMQLASKIQFVSILLNLDEMEYASTLFSIQYSN